MSKPRNWHEMTSEQRREWQRAEDERYDLERQAEDNRRAAERAERAAAEAKRHAQNERIDAEEQRQNLCDRIDELAEELADVRAMLLSLVTICQGIAVEFPPDADLPQLVALRQWLVTFAQTPEGREGGGK